MMASSFLLSTYTLFVGICQSEITQQNRNQIEQLTSTFGYTSTDFVNGIITEQQLIEFYDANLTPDFIINFGGYEVSGLQSFKEFYIPILKTQKSLNNVPGAVNYVSIDDDKVVVRNNDIVTSFDKATDTLPEMFEAIHFTNIWTLTREQPYDTNIFKLKYFQFHIDVRFPDIAMKYNIPSAKGKKKSDSSSGEAVHFNNKMNNNNDTLNTSKGTVNNIIVICVLMSFIFGLLFGIFGLYLYKRMHAQNKDNIEKELHDVVDVNDKVRTDNIETKVEIVDHEQTK